MLDGSLAYWLSFLVGIDSIYGLNGVSGWPLNKDKRYKTKQKRKQEIIKANYNTERRTKKKNLRETEKRIFESKSAKQAKRSQAKQGKAKGQGTDYFSVEFVKEGKKNASKVVARQWVRVVLCLHAWFGTRFPLVWFARSCGELEGDNCFWL